MQLRIKNASFYFQLGDLLISIKDLDNAFNSYQKAIKLNPSYIISVLDKLKILFREQANDTNNGMHINFSPKSEVASLS